MTKTDRKGLVEAQETGKQDAAVPPPRGAPQGPEEQPSKVLPTQDFYKSVAYLSIWGPCRGVGDEYLNCVVTEGMGMCKPLRRTFEKCAMETSGSGVQMLDQLANQACQHVGLDADNPKDRLVARRNCAAQFMMSQQQQQQNGPSY